MFQRPKTKSGDLFAGLCLRRRSPVAKDERADAHDGVRGDALRDGGGRPTAAGRAAARRAAKTASLQPVCFDSVVSSTPLRRRKISTRVSGKLQQRQREGGEEG